MVVVEGKPTTIAPSQFLLQRMGPGLRRDDDEEANALIPATRFRPGCANSSSLSSSRGRGKSRAPEAPAASHAKQRKRTSNSPQVQPVTPAFPAQWFTAYTSSPR